MATITGTSGRDTLTGTAGDDTISGLGEDDTLLGGAGNDTIYGESSSGVDGAFDWASFSTSPNAVSANLGAGTAADGFGGTDTLIGIEGLIGSAFSDTLVGGSAGFVEFYQAEAFEGLAGNDTLNGGDADPASVDVVRYERSPSGVNVNLGTGTASDGWGGTDTLININGVIGSAFNDTLIGSSADDFFQGGAGSDSIVGGAGSDTIDHDAAGGGAITVNLATGVFKDNFGNTDIVSGVENVIGSFFNDSITGDTNANRLEGEQGNDTLTGGPTSDTAADILMGWQGDDVLRQTQGADTLDGGEGFDRIDFTQTGIAYGGAIGVTVNLATHVSDLNNSAAGANATLVSIESVFGTAGNDVFTGGDAAHAPDALGNGTTENFRPGGGNDIMTGGAGEGFFTRVDYSNSTSAVTVNLGTGIASDGFGGTDTLVRVDYVFGGSANDVLYGGGLERSTNGGFYEVFRGNSGNDTIDGAGTDTVLGAAGTDRANYGNSPAAVIVNLGTTPYVVGADTVPGGAGRDGFGFTDTLRNIDQVQGSAFNDRLVGGADNHRLIGDAGNDTLVGGAYGVEASYQNSTAAIIAGLAAGTASDGLGGTDTLVNIADLRGSDFNDTLTGNSADNRLAGEAGADSIDGGAGIDFASYNGVPLANGGVNAFIENGAGMVNDGFGSTDTLSNIEGLIGTHSSDTLAGGLGSQWFIGHGGSDNINGGAGNDWVSYTDDKIGVIVNLSTGSATDGWGAVWGYGGIDTLISIENVEGSDFADTLIGDDGPNELRGRDGDDTLTGGGGNDTLNGGAGNDTAVFSGNRSAYTISATAFGHTVSGPNGFDTLIGIEHAKFADTTAALDASFVVDEVITGTDDNDTLTGGSANDYIQGGAGNDLLVGNDGDDILDGGTGADRMEGGNGNDTYYVDNSGDAVVETSNGQGISLASGEMDALTALNVAPHALEGFTDTVIAAINYSLANVAFVENLTLAGTATTATGNALDNVLIGNALNNTLTGGAGIDTIDGGAGIDTAVFGGNRAASIVTQTASGFTVSGPDGTDTLTNIERLKFADKKIAIDLGANTAGGNTVRIIGAAFDAPVLSNSTYVGIGLSLFDGGMSMGDVCQLAIGAMGSPGNVAFVTTVYTNVVGAAPSQAALDLYVGLLAGSGGTMTQAQLLEIAANAEINATDNINLVGLQPSGVEFYS